MCIAASRGAFLRTDSRLKTIEKYECSCRSPKTWIVSRIEIAGRTRLRRASPCPATVEAGTLWCDGFDGHHECWQYRCGITAGHVDRSNSARIERTGSTRDTVQIGGLDSCGHFR